MHPFAAALVSIVMSVAAQFALKHGMESGGRAAMSDGLNLKAVWLLCTNPGVLGGLALYALGAVVWLAVLARWDVSKAYPLVGLGFVATVLVGWWLGESVGPQRWLGVAAICTGVWLVARS
jgi:multidrug transporter EmrE-like cation transporter